MGGEVGGAQNLVERERLGDDDLLLPGTGDGVDRYLFARGIGQNFDIPRDVSERAGARRTDIELEAGLGEGDDFFVFRAEGKLQILWQDAEALGEIGDEEIVKCVEIWIAGTGVLSELDGYGGPGGIGLLGVDPLLDGGVRFGGWGIAAGDAAGCDAGEVDHGDVDTSAVKGLADIVNGDLAKGGAVGEMDDGEVGDGGEGGCVGVGPAADLFEGDICAVDGGGFAHLECSGGCAIGVAGNEFFAAGGIGHGGEGGGIAEGNGGNFLAVAPLMEERLRCPGENGHEDEELRLLSLGEPSVIHSDLLLPVTTTDVRDL